MESRDDHVTSCNPPSVPSEEADSTRAGFHEQALEHYKSLFQHARDIVLSIRRDGRIIEANPAAERAYGYSHEELLALTMEDLRASDTIPDMENQMGQADSEGILFETVHRRKDGSTFPVEVSSQGATVGGQRILLSVIRDITERKQSERQLQETQAALTAVIQASPLAIIALDKEYRVLLWNPGAEQLFGWSEEEVRGKPYPLVPVEGRAEFEESYGQMLRGEFRQGREVRRRRKDGSVLDLGIWTSVLRGADGETEAVVGVLADISERKRAEAERERLLAQLDATITSMVDAVVVLGPSGEIVRMNESADRLFGYSPEERGLSLSERAMLRRFESPEGNFISPDELPAQRALRGETTHGMLAVIRSPEGASTWLSISAAPIRDGEGRVFGAVASFVDISAMHDLQEQRRRHILGMSHGLRTPLTVIQGQAQMLEQQLKRGGTDEAIGRKVQAILTAALKMSVVVRDLVDLTHLESGQALWLNRQPLDLRAFLVHLLERKPGILLPARIGVEAAKDLPRVQADPDRLERVLIHLLTNAQRFSDPGTPIVVKLERKGSEVVIAVADRGLGMSPQVRARLFGQRPTEPIGGGAGLGVYICRGLVEASGGRIWVESEEGKGSTFYFTLPVWSSREESSLDGR